MRHKLLFLFVGVFICVMNIGCAKSVILGNPFASFEEPFFDDGIDVVVDYSTLSGQWAFSAEEELDARCNLSDVVAEVTIVSVQINSDVAGQEERRIEIKLDSFLYGALDTNNFLLISQIDAKGYALLQRHEIALKGKQLLFLRTFPLDKENNDGEMGHHFHLSPHAPAILSKTNTLINKRKKEMEKE